MKKFTALLLIAAMVIALAACGGTDTPQTTNGSGETVGNTTTALADESDAPSESTVPSEAQIVFEEITVVDNDECSLVITSYAANSREISMKAVLENKSADRNYMFTVESASVNGILTDPWYADTVAAGKKANGTISFGDSELFGLTPAEVTDIELTFRVYDSDDFLADAVAHETIHVYPYGPNAATVFTREAQPSDLVLVDNDEITVIATGFDPGSVWGYTMNLYLVNKTDKTLMFSLENVSVNGLMVDPFWACDVIGNKVAFSSVSWNSSDFEENDITTVEEIEFSLRVSDYEDWSANDLFNEVLTVNP